MLEIVKCKCDFQINPLGIDNPEPAFGWQLQSEESDVMQESYLIAVQDEREKEVWNSGWIKSSDCIGIRYQGWKLESRTAYFWRVYVKDRHGREAVSRRNSFETAFLPVSAGVALSFPLIFFVSWKIL